LQGPPGVGKTFIARKLAYEIMQEIKDANIEMVQFHQSYCYEDFIQGLRPTQKGGFDLRNGLSLYRKKFGVREIGHILYALTYFDDADQERMPFMLWETDWRMIKKTIRGWVRDWVEHGI